MKRFSPGIVAAIVAIGGVALAHAAEEMEPTVQARHGHMNILALNVGVLGGMARGQAEYDADAAQAAANNILAIAQIDQRNYWAEGTEAGASTGSRALPAIWENMDDFMAKNDDLIFAAEAMADAAGTDLASLQAAMGNLGGSCSGCHREYRTREE